MTTFALVHGAFCSGSTWDLLRSELERRRHTVVAMDLPCDDPEAGCARYAETVVAALGGHDDPVVLVGHSLGGLTIPLVAAARPIAKMVFLAAFIPRPGGSFRDQFASEEGMFPPSDPATWPIMDEATGLLTWPPERVIPALMPDVPPELAAAAAAGLRRQSTTPHDELCSLRRWPRASRARTSSARRIRRSAPAGRGGLRRSGSRRRPWSCRVGTCRCWPGRPSSRTRSRPPRYPRP